LRPSSKNRAGLKASIVSKKEPFFTSSWKSLRFFYAGCVKILSTIHKFRSNSEHFDLLGVLIKDRSNLGLKMIFWAVIG